MITVNGNWQRAFEGEAASLIEDRLPAFLTASRWFGGKARRIQSAGIRELIPIDDDSSGFMLLFVEIGYVGGGGDTYAVPITAAFGETAERISRECAQAIISELQMVGLDGQKTTGLLYDALWSEEGAYVILNGIGSGARFRGIQGTIVGSPTEAFVAALVQPPLAHAAIMKGEQSNTSIRFDDKAIVKMYRRLEQGVNPDLEIGRVLTARGFGHTPSVLGALEYVREQQEPVTLAIAQQFIPNEGDGWRYTTHELQQYFDRIVAQRGYSHPPAPSLPGQAPSPSHPPAPSLPEQAPSSSHPPAPNLPGQAPSSSHPPAPSLPGQAPFPTPKLSQHKYPAGPNDFPGGGSIQAAACLGQRTAELHMTLAQNTDDGAFAPEPCSPEYLRLRYETMHRLTERSLALLRENVARLPDADRSKAQQVLAMESALDSRMRALLTVESTALLIRCHGDYHLGQVLYKDGDFVIIDFEGEPARPLAERRTKHLPILDVAGMIRSFHYAAYVALRDWVARSGASPDRDDLESWARTWYWSARAAFLQAYTNRTASASFHPRSQEEFTLLLNIHLLEKAVYELGYELNNRPAWVAIPLQGILEGMRNDDCPVASPAICDAMIE